MADLGRGENAIYTTPATLKAPISATLKTTRKGYPFVQKPDRRLRVDVVLVRLESDNGSVERDNGSVESDNRSVDNVIGRRQRPLRFYVFRPPFRPAPISATLNAPISATLKTTRKGYPFAQKPDRRLRVDVVLVRLESDNGSVERDTGSIERDTGSVESDNDSFDRSYTSTSYRYGSRVTTVRSSATLVRSRATTVRSTTSSVADNGRFDSTFFSSVVSTRAYLRHVKSAHLRHVKNYA